MVIYEVNIAVDDKLATDYLEWLDGHIAEMLRFRGFVASRVMQVDDPPGAPGTKNYCVQYQLVDAESLDHYLSNHAAGMRQAGLEAFGDGFSTSRRILSDYPWR